MATIRRKAGVIVPSISWATTGVVVAPIPTLAPVTHDPTANWDGTVTIRVDGWQHDGKWPSGTVKSVQEVFYRKFGWALKKKHVLFLCVGTGLTY